MAVNTFSDFKTNFYLKVTDFEIFGSGEDLNIFKIALEGLKVNYAGRMNPRTFIFKPYWFKRIIFALYQIKYAALIKQMKEKFNSVKHQLNRPNLIVDTGRVIKDGNENTISFYFQKILDTIGPQNTCVLFQKTNVLTSGIHLTSLEYINKYNPLNDEERELTLQLKNTYTRIRSEKIFGPKELKNIEIAIDKFFNEFRFWNFILKGRNIKRCFFMPHYHNEGMVFALKRNKIQTIEIQHGLIAPEDIFYVFPKSISNIASKALFPDKIFTFGSYWKSILDRGGEFMPEQVQVLGMYLEVSNHIEESKKLQLDNFLHGDDFILVTTQTFLHEYFVEYVQLLSADLFKISSDAKIVVKNHPSEKSRDYEVLHNLSNVLVLNANTEYLLSACKWHVSCYSTTLYDATKYNCINYSLFIESCMDYVDNFLKEGISTLIYKEQNPVSFHNQSPAQLSFDKDTLFENFELYKYKLAGQD